MTNDELQEWACETICDNAFLQSNAVEVAEAVAAQHEKVRRVLADFYRTPISLSSAQPILDLAVELNPELAKEQYHPTVES